MAITKADLERIAKYMLDGLSEDDACSLCELDTHELHELKELSGEVRLYLERKAIKFKQMHLNEIAKTKSEKNSMWLLEKLRPEEFGAKQKTTNPTTINIIRTMVNSIQNGEKYSTLTPRSRGNLAIESNEDDVSRIAVESVLN